MKSTMLRGCLAVSTILLLVTLRAASGQTPGTGAISGIVYDPANRVVAHAEVIAIEESTQVTRRVATTSEGVFRVPLLSPGAYTVTVTATGFATSTAHGVQVSVSQTTALNLKLVVAGTSSSVQVSAGSQMADLDSSTIGGLVDQTAIEELPLANRNYTQILALAPGVIVDLPVPTQLGRGSQNVASDGATPTANNIQFNGIDANNLTQNSAANAESSQVGVAVPAPDTIQEFRVQTANFDGAYGRGSGANVDAISKGGTNHFHGSVWEFVRNNIFDANDFFSKLNQQPRAELKHNQFGASLGGPIRSDKTFFFVAYQGLTEVNGLGDETQATLPVLSQDRSAATLGAQFCPAGHLDDGGQPATGYFTQAGGVQVACDGSNINPVALAVLNAKLPNGQFAVPSPQTVIQSTGPDASDQFPVGQSIYTLPARYREDQFTVDIDQNLNNKNMLSGRFFYSRAPTTKPFSPNGGANVPGWGSDELDRNTMFVLADTHSFNSNLVNVARFGYMRFDGNSEVENPLSAQDIGIATPTGAVGAGLHAPAIWALFMIGDAGTPSQWQVTNSFTWQDTVALTRGRHSARFGAEFKRHQVDVDSPVETDGLLQLPSFEDFLLGESAAQNGSPQGVSNVGTTQSGGGLFRRNERYTNFAAFAQDDVKLMRRLTLNAGLRYEIFGAPTEINGRFSNFNANIAVGDPGANDPYSGFVVPANFQAPIPLGVRQSPYAGLWKTPYGDVSPRFGFVWQMTSKPTFVLRGGYGWYFDEHSANIAENIVSQPPFSTLNIVSGEPNGGATLQSPYVTLVPPPSSFPIFVPRSAATPLSFTEGIDPNVKDGKTEEYNLNVQYAFASNYLLQAGYVGTRSVHRPGQVEFNQATLARPENPINGETTNSVNNVTARQPYQGVPEGSLFTVSDFIGNYNSLQASLIRRLAHGLQFQANYTWSKNLDEVNAEGGLDQFELQLPTNDQRNLREASYGLAGDDRAQRLAVNFTWAVPALRTAPTLVRHLLTDWKFSGIGVIQSGAALSIFDSNAGSVYGNLTSQSRAQSAGKDPRTHGSLFSRVVGSGRYLDASAFTRAPEAPNGTSIADEDFGNSGVGMVRGPGQHNLDMAVERVFPVKETSSFLLRAEFFNVTNTPQFGNPNTGLGYGNPNLPAVASSTFGQITGEEGGPHPRIIQFAAKYVF